MYLKNKNYTTQSLKTTITNSISHYLAQSDHKRHQCIQVVKRLSSVDDARSQRVKITLLCFSYTQVTAINECNYRILYQWPSISKKNIFDLLLVAGFLFHACLLLALSTWKPSAEDSALFYVIAACWGVCNAVWETLNFGNTRTKKSTQLNIFLDNKKLLDIHYINYHIINITSHNFINKIVQ